MPPWTHVLHKGKAVLSSLMPEVLAVEPQGCTCCGVAGGAGGAGPG
jgi:hypothetical protein